MKPQHTSKIMTYNAILDELNHLLELGGGGGVGADHGGDIVDRLRHRLEHLRREYIVGADRTQAPPAEPR